MATLNLFQSSFSASNIIEAGLDNSSTFTTAFGVAVGTSAGVELVGLVAWALWSDLDSRGYVQEPPRLSYQPGSATYYPQLDLSVAVQNGTAFTADLSVWVQATATPSAFSSSNRFFSSSDSWVQVGSAVAADWSGSGVGATINVPLTTAHSSGLGSALLLDFWSGMQYTWNGRQNFAIRVDTSGLGATQNVGFDGTLTLYRAPFNTGIQSGRRNDRMAMDMRTGVPSFAGDLIEDGYRPGIWTRPENYDPPDPRDIQPVQLPETEGEVFDEVPS